MENLLKSITDEAAKEIAALKVSEMLPGDIDESMADEMKYPDMADKFKSASKDMKEQKNKLIQDSMKDGSSYLESVKSDLNDLGTNAGQLVVMSAQFSARLAVVPAAIVSATPVGPGVSANLVMPLVQQLKSEGDNLSTVYDKCNTSINKLGLNSLSEKLPSIAGVLSVVTGAMAVAKPLIKLVGASVGDEPGDNVEVNPPIEIKLNAEDCLNYIAYDPELPISFENCSNFDIMIEGGERSCDNCKRFNKRL